ncbi:6-hydroxymethylpterin diphosphokinase MptE-like protein [Ruegeria sp. HKCCA5426]|uniref:6-hydroxymethylpterin diphosphokinase MptE-like protein n=1 Tax=Ruegeria sp. HKCCA5426 TaxID=2682985 RepID=UPI001488A581|nr:6-hydroxymethylpterin diphosphokinase MptE-like protein [Ruegeria sp. HKCCA5426]
MVPLWKIKRELQRAFVPGYRTRIYSHVSKRDKNYLNGLTKKYARNRCFIIGNGPSLAASDLEKIKDEISFASNKIFLIYDQTSWRPNFYCVEDKLVFTQCLDEIQKLSGCKKLFPANLFSDAKKFEGAVCFPLIPPKNWDNPLEDPEFPEFNPDLTSGIAWGSTIVYTEIQLAIAMGFTEICLLGLDHQYTDGKVSEGEKGVMVSDGEQNHFHPLYRLPGEKWHSPNLHVLEVSYAKARSEAEKLGVRIVNCSRRTRLNVFEREELESVLARSSSGKPNLTGQV